MGKKRQIDLLTINIEDKLDKNGALRNVAVKDAWQRLRQKIEVVRTFSPFKNTPIFPFLSKYL